MASNQSKNTGKRLLGRKVGHELSPSEIAHVSGGNGGNTGPQGTRDTNYS